MMKVFPTDKITVRNLVDEYEEIGANGEGGVTGYGGVLNIRPPYQREFVYETRDQEKVIQTILEGAPLGLMYWFSHDDGKMEVMDGQQRSISIARFIEGDYSVVVDGNRHYFHTLSPEEQERVLNYELLVYECKGSEKERIRWFERINIAGKPLKSQEIRNATYNGTWVTDARNRFGRRGCLAEVIGGHLTSGEVHRQKLLETAIQWKIGSKNSSAIEDYMSAHRSNKSAKDLWLHFKTIVEWVAEVFPKKRDKMKSVDWGKWYALYGNDQHDQKEYEDLIQNLEKNDNLSKKTGIYEYVLTRDETHLTLRLFDADMKSNAYDKQRGICPGCNKKFPIERMEGDHIIPWIKNGPTTEDNCQMLCKPCNAGKGAK